MKPKHTAHQFAELCVFIIIIIHHTIFIKNEDSFFFNKCTISWYNGIKYLFMEHNYVIINPVHYDS